MLSRIILLPLAATLLIWLLPDPRRARWLAGMGVPATSGFPAEFLILVSALNTHTGAGLAALFGLVVGAGYFLSAYRLAFLGPLGNAVIADAADLRPRELVLVSVLALLVLAAGLYPQGVLDLTRATTETWMERIPVAGF